jgi:hypothetical protein
MFTDEYAIYNRLEQWGVEHKTVNHSAGEYARDEDGALSCARGYARIAAYRKKSFPSPCLSLSSRTTFVGVEKRS